jgi:hypothetical protein
MEILRDPRAFLFSRSPCLQPEHSPAQPRAHDQRADADRERSAKQRGTGLKPLCLPVVREDFDRESRSLSFQMPSPFSAMTRNR